MTEEDIKAVAAEIQEYMVTTQRSNPRSTTVPSRLASATHLGGFEKKNPSTATSLWDVENWYFIP